MGGKNSAGGPKWVVKQDRLVEALDYEKSQINHLLDDFSPQVSEDKLLLLQEQLQEVNKVFRVWINLYHSLALLTAAKYPPGTNPVTENTPGVTDELDCGQASGEKCLECSYQLPAFKLGDDSEEGMFKFLDLDSGSEFEAQYDNIIATFRENFSVKNLSRDMTGSDITEAIVRWSALDSDSTDDPPLLQWFLTKLGPLLPDTDHFDPGQCLAICRGSIPRVRQTENVTCKDTEKVSGYVDRALYRITEIWGENIESRLAQVQTWVEEAENDSDPFEDWLRKKFNVTLSSATSPRDFLNEATKSDDEKAKWVVGGMIAMLDFTKPILELIYSRCFDDSGSWPPVSLEELKHDLTKDMTDEEKKHWANLFAATYGAIAWHIFHQVIPTLQLLKVSSL